MTFRLAVESWFAYRSRLSKTSSEYDHCPVECPRSKPKIDLRRAKHCDKCPRIEKYREFKRDVERKLENALGDEWENVDFDHLVRHIQAVQTARELSPAERSTTLAAYVAAYENARARFDEREKALSGE